MSEEEFCRLCASLTNNLKSKNLFNHCQQKLLCQVEELTGMQLENTNHLPQHICIPCQAQTKQAYEFRERCIRTQQHFLTSSKYRNTMEAPTEECCGDQFEIKVINEAEEENKEDKEEEIKDALLMPIEELQIKQEFTNTYDEQLPDNLLDNDCEESLAIQKTNCSIKKRKRKEYICEYCNRHFKDNSVLKQHSIRHTGIRQFQCEHCPKKFYTSQERIAHIRTHTGERPFPCRYCEFRFRTSNQRKIHECIHTNDRPYNCHQCNQSFITSKCLTIHMLKHTGERPFECIYCKVSYRCKKHLVVHNRTEKHKRTIENCGILDN